MFSRCKSTLSDAKRSERYSTLSDIIFIGGALLLVGAFAFTINEKSFLMFAGIVSIILSLVLELVSRMLKAKSEANAEADAEEQQTVEKV
jgi:hypothetical protein